MNEKITNGETTTKEILKVVSDIKEGYSDTKFALLTITNTQKTQADNDRNSKDLFMEQFRAIKEENKAIKDERIADNLRVTNERKESAKSKVISDEVSRVERVKTRVSIYVAVAVVVANTLIGLMFKMQ